ncbi:1,6-anhydro-N-acetylmuramyl-L-alanine amidase AmpD [Polynucleobacter sp. UK-Kesae-W10]|uniref:1,6-anhydro-N-acetylmuramyl-L-alanine amidase AmpD n=1 Tax=Polynucleobacter sp. UK-Kesae-W10 TaxID=1819738 RepID=UPI002103245C|nr:1,6-anhydro-N-acetylmuramyl-L-alanine amidase AmpD [Polynucleobacter sp. UK-Kesae-W10]
MFKWLLLFALGYFFYRWLQLQKRSKETLKKAPEPSPQKALEPEPVVQCHHCKVHLPSSEAIANDARFYCSQEHLQSLDEQGWVGNAAWRLSPNYDARPEGVRPDVVVIHHISLPPGEFKYQESSRYIVDFFQNHLDPGAHPYFAEIAGQQVSSHFLITRSGRLIQFVSTQNKAWHAGLSSFLGREKCNDFSIGIELEGDGESAFEEAQYQALANLVKILEGNYSPLQFAGHSDIAPNRKTDPGIFFDWKKFQKETGISSEKLPYGLTSR